MPKRPLSKDPKDDLGADLMARQQEITDEIRRHCDRSPSHLSQVNNGSVEDNQFQAQDPGKDNESSS